MSKKLTIVELEELNNFICSALTGYMGRATYDVADKSIRESMAKSCCMLGKEVYSQMLATVNVMEN